MSSARLAARMLGASGTLVVESRVSGGFAPFSDPVLLYEVAFASRPRSAGFPGLCVADIYTVSLVPSVVRGTGEPGSNVQSLSVNRRYGVIDGLDPIASGWNDAYGNRLQAECAASGPVLTGNRYFEGRFRGSSDFWAGHAWFAARALALAQREGVVAASCSDERGRGNSGLCDDPHAVAKALRLTALGNFAVDVCADRPLTYCVTATFTRDPGNAGSHRLLIVTIATDTMSLAGPVDEIRIRSIALEGSSYVN